MSSNSVQVFLGLLQDMFNTFSMFSTSFFFTNEASDSLSGFFNVFLVEFLFNSLDSTSLSARFNCTSSANFVFTADFPSVGLASASVEWRRFLDMFLDVMKSFFATFMDFGNTFWFVFANFVSKFSTIVSSQVEGLEAFLVTRS